MVDTQNHIINVTFYILQGKKKEHKKNIEIIYRHYKGPYFWPNLEWFVGCQIFSPGCHIVVLCITFDTMTDTAD